MAAPILVTGGTGTLGRLLVTHLTDAGRPVRVLSRSHHDNTDVVEFVTGDLLTGDGLATAVEGAATIVHCASSYKGDPVAAGNLLRAAAAAQPGVTHVVYISIVGIDAAPITGLARRPLSYPLAKLEVEGLVESSGIPWTILRATQFHSLVFTGARTLTKLPLVPVPGGLKFQPVDEADVAKRLAELALDAPAGRVPDIGGPEAATFAGFFRTYLRITHRRRVFLPIRMPGRFAQAMRNGSYLVPADLEPGNARGRRTWGQYVLTRLASEARQPVGSGAGSAPTATSASR
jgi:uncharacterized protein YbjT (DUF2867 family)